MSRLKKTIYNNKVLSRIVVPVYHRVNRARNFSSQKYWENRYKSGGDSGAGSYGRLAEFKAKVINDFVKENGLNGVLELGTGDGSQLELLKIKRYIGFDVSETAVSNCIKKYSDDKGKSFFIYSHKGFHDNLEIFSVDMTMSLDVIYHLVEDDTFNGYMTDLFSIAKKYVLIYSSNMENTRLSRAQHVRHRKFSDWIENNASSWRLLDHIENKYSLSADLIDESPADFYIYENKVSV